MLTIALGILLALFILASLPTIVGAAAWIVGLTVAGTLMFLATTIFQELTPDTQLLLLGVFYGAIPLLYGIKFLGDRAEARKALRKQEEAAEKFGY